MTCIIHVRINSVSYLCYLEEEKGRQSQTRETLIGRINYRTVVYIYTWLINGKQCPKLYRLALNSVPLVGKLSQCHCLKTFIYAQDFESWRVQYLR